MSGVTFDEVLTLATRLPGEEQELLAEILRKRGIEKWRAETSAEARRVTKAFGAGKLKAQSADSAIDVLRKSLDEDV